MNDDIQRKKIAVSGKMILFLLANFPTTMHFMFLIMIWTFDISRAEMWYAYKIFLIASVPLSLSTFLFVLFLLKPVNAYLRLRNEGEEDVDPDIMEAAWRRAADLPGMLVFATGGGVFLMGALLWPILEKFDYFNMTEMMYVGFICTLGSLILSSFMYFVPRRLMEPVLESIAEKLDIGWTGWKYTIAVRSLITGFIISLTPGLFVGLIGLRQATFAVQKDARENSFKELKVLEGEVTSIYGNNMDKDDLASLLKTHSSGNFKPFVINGKGAIIAHAGEKPSPDGIKGILNGEDSGIWRLRATYEYIPYMKLGYSGLIIGLAGRADEIPQGFARSRYKMLVVVGLTFLIAISAALLFAMSISRPVRRLTERIKEAERDKGTLLEKVYIITEDEVGDLVDAFNRMVDLNVREVTRREQISEEVKASIQKLHKFSTEVLKSSSKQAEGAGEQASSIQEATTASLEIANTSKQINERALSVRELSEQSWKACRDGQEDVDSTFEGVNSMGELLDETAVTLDKLRSKSKAIERVLVLIKDISEKTNLLSLNAALEASSAGESGKRFAVVAEQVRRLAERSHTAAEEVSMSLVEISSLIEGSAQVSERGREVAREGMALMDRLKGAFTSINDSIRSFHDAASEISLSTKQQNTASEQMVEVLSQVADLARAVAGDSRDIQKSITELKSLSDTLHGLVEED